MAKLLIFNILLMTLLRVDSCLIADSIYVPVPRTIPPQYEITTVEVDNCDTKSLRFTSRDPSFTIRTNGAVVALTPVYVGTGGRTFSVVAQDNSGPESEMVVHLVSSTLRGKKQRDSGFLKRTKRRWSPPPFNIIENYNGPFPKEMEKIVSDSEAKFSVYYTISGPGFDSHPLRLFSLDRETGMLSVHRSIDREEFPKFVLTVRVFDKTTNQETDLPLDIQILVDDVNDNAPEFSGSMQFTVLEQSKIGTVVGKVNSTDKDAQNTNHVEVKYTLLDQKDMFAINPSTGEITTVTSTMDRETQDKYMVKIEIRDLNGAANGLSTTGTATITVGDINDNPPTFTKTSYTATVKENESEKLVLRIPVEDKDLKGTPNWKSKFVITKGSEHFRIETDPETNEGLLYIAKPLDFEKSPDVEVMVMARNEAELTGTTAQWQSIPINIKVTDVDEGPEFIAPTIRFNIKENTPNGTKIGMYTAVDPETKSSEGIRYYKVKDPASWVSVDRNTGELKVANTIDRESNYVKDGLYNITMKAVDAGSKSGIGTVILHVEDVNDNQPMVPTAELSICEKEGELGSVLVVAEDKDMSPLGAPFSFNMPDDSDGTWTLVPYNDTAATLKHTKQLPTGIYQVPVIIKDLQGTGETQTVTVRICQCRGGVCLSKDTSVSFGPLGILTMLLPLALLLLLCLLIFFFCETKGDKLQIEDTGESGGILLPSNTEGRGDEVDCSLITVPVQNIGMEQVTKEGTWPGIKATSSLESNSGLQENWMNKTTIDTRQFTSGQYDNQYSTGFGGQFQSQYGGQLVGSAASFGSRQQTINHHTWQTNGRYLNQKLGYMGEQEDERYADDIIHPYGYEGAGSAAGSVGCCSELGENENLDFLNTLGPKFKTLADVCRKT